MQGISNPILPTLRKVTQVPQVSAAPQHGHCPDAHSSGGGGGVGHYAGDRCSRLLLLRDAMCLPKAMSPCWTTATSHACRRSGRWSLQPRRDAGGLPPPSLAGGTHHCPRRYAGDGRPAARTPRSGPSTASITGSSRGRGQTTARAPLNTRSPVPVFGDADDPVLLGHYRCHVHHLLRALHFIEQEGLASQRLGLGLRRHGAGGHRRCRRRRLRPGEGGRRPALPRRRRDLPEPGAAGEAGTARRWRHRPRAGRAGPGRAGRGALR